MRHHPVAIGGHFHPWRRRDILHLRSAFQPEQLNPREVQLSLAGQALSLIYTPTNTTFHGKSGLVGLKGYVTNIDAALMPSTEVIASYHDLWRVEQSFRMSKSDLAARPMFARTRDAIEAHLTIVFTALALSREVQTRTGLSLRRFLRTLKPLRSATIDINGVIATYPPALNPEVEAILNALQTANSRH
jgi:hypothetical protein